jgi:hypothetical protein
MSNNNTTFKLQSFGTTSALGPHVIDEARYIAPDGDGVGSEFTLADLPVRDNAPIIVLNDATRVYFFAVKFDRVNSTTVSSVSFPLRDLVVNGDPLTPDTLTGSLNFYTRSDLGLSFTLTALAPAAIPFTLTTNELGAKYITISFASVVLPPAGLTAFSDIIPVYIGIKLKDAFADMVAFNADTVVVDAGHTYAFYLSTAPSTGLILSTYVVPGVAPSPVYTFTDLSVTPVLYLS